MDIDSLSLKTFIAPSIILSGPLSGCGFLFSPLFRSTAITLGVFNLQFTFLVFIASFEVEVLYFVGILWGRDGWLPALMYSKRESEFEIF